MAEVRGWYKLTSVFFCLPLGGVLSYFEGDLEGILLGGGGAFCLGGILTGYC